MPMAVQYKFKSAKDFDSVPIDEHCISIGRLKEKILLKLKLGNGASDFDLVLSNAESDEEYLDEEFLVWEDTSVLVRRVPRKAVVQQQEGNDISNTVSIEPQPVQVTPSIASDEDVRIKEFVDSSAADWLRQTNENSAARGQGLNLQKKVPHQGYVCHRCGVAGHFIQHCPTNGDPSYDVKKMKLPSGIPRTMLVANPDGTYALPTGETAAMKPNEEAFEKEIQGVIPTETSAEVPSELRCPLCQNALRDAVLTSKCCFKSFCDSCIRHVLLEKTTCVCGARNIRADDLLPNKTLRETVDRLLSGSPLPSVNASAEKPQSQASADSTTTQDVVSVPLPDEKVEEGKEELEELEEVDYDEEGFDDLNIDELELEPPEQSAQTPESDATKDPHVEDKKSPEPVKESKDEVADQPETKLEVQCAEPAKYSGDLPKQRPGSRPNPYAMHYAGYWSASQMVGDACRPPFGYPGYFPGCFPGPAQFPFQPYPGPKSSNRLLSREEFEARKSSLQRRRVPLRRGRVSGDGAFHQERRGGRSYRPKSKSPPRRRRSRSPRTHKLQHSSPPRRESASPPKYRRRSVSPIRRRQASPGRSHLSPPIRSKSRSPPRNNDISPLRHSRVRETDTSRWSPQRCRRYGPSKQDDKFLSKEIREKISRDWHSRGIDLSPRRNFEPLGRHLSEKPEFYSERVPERQLYREDVREPRLRKLVPVSRIPESRESFAVNTGCELRVGVMRRRPGVGDGFDGTVEVPRKSKCILRAARGASAELQDDIVDDGLYRRYIDEEERVTLRRPVVTTTVMQRKRGKNLIVRPMLRSHDEDDDDEVELESSLRRTAVFQRRGAYMEDEEYAERVDDEAEWTVHRTSQSCMPRKRPRALAPARQQRFAVMDEEEEYGFDAEEDLMEGNEDMELIAPPRALGLMKRKRLLAKQRALIQEQQQQQQQENLVVSRPKRKKAAAANGIQAGGASNMKKQCKLVKSVFERISFNETPETRNKNGKKLRKIAGSTAAGGATGGPRMVVFYGDVS